MTATEVHIPRTGPAIREALAQYSPDEVSEFEAELRAALVASSGDLDTSRVDKVLTHWCAIAHLRADPLSEEEEASLVRARQGDFTGFRARDANGGWFTI